MAITFQLEDDLDLSVQQLADAKGISKEQLLRLALSEYVERARRLTHTLSNADRVVRENGPLLDRLGQ